jgi:hypothetical protein
MLRGPDKDQNTGRTVEFVDIADAAMGLSAIVLVCMGTYLLASTPLASVPGMRQLALWMLGGAAGIVVASTLLWSREFD